MKSRYDQPLKKLCQARNELRQEYVRIRHELVRLEKMIAQLEAMNAASQESSRAASGVADTVEQITAKDIEGLSHAQAATLILARSGSPLTIRQLLEVFRRAGRTFSAKNGYGILHKSLRKHKQFDSVAGRWRLANGFDGSHGSGGGADAC